MPYPSKTDFEAVIEAARGLIERNGVEQLSLGALAAELGIKPPSLYRHVESKASLLRAVNERTFERLFEAYNAAMRESGDDPQDRVWAVFRGHRAFAHANPITYVMAFSASNPDERVDPKKLVDLVLPIQEIMAAIVGQARSLTALRGALALVHGFVMLELSNQLQRGGDLEEAYEAALETYLRGWTATARATKRSRPTGPAR